jgi:PAS domain S-box-containing protein
MSSNQNDRDDPRSLLACIVESSQDAIISKSLDGIVTSWNRSAERIFGYTSHEMIGQPIALLIPDGQSEDLPAILRAVRDGDRIEHYETRRRTKDGRIIDVSITVSPIRDALGNIIGASKIARDITERKRAEDRLRAYSGTTGILSDAADRRAGVQGVTEVLCRHLGWQGGSLWLRAVDRRSIRCVQTWRESGPDTDRPSTERDGETLRPGEGLPGRAWATGLPVRASRGTSVDGREDGEPAYESAREGGVAFPIVLDRDVVGIMELFGEEEPAEDPGVDEFLMLIGRQVGQFLERKQAEEALRVSQERLRRVSECGILSIAFFTEQGRVVDANEAFLELVGFRREQIEADLVWWDRLAPPEAADRASRSIEELFRTGKVSPCELEYQRRDGSRFWGLFGGALLEDTHLGVGFLIDISDRKLAEQEREQLLTRLREADRLKNEFLAMLSHELRNPLAAIGTAVELLDLALDQAEHRSWALAVVGRQVRNLTRLTDDLLDVARITQGKISLKKRLIDASEVIRQAVETVGTLLDDREHRLEVSVEPGLMIQADPTRLEQIVVNLLSNAVKYTDSGGLIRVEARGEGSDVVCTVRDNGAGIPPDRLASMFELFVQGDRGISRSEGGLGIGLTMVKSLAEMHSGVVLAHSEGPGKGSEFSVRLPATGKPAVSPLKAAT